MVMVEGYCADEMTDQSHNKSLRKQRRGSNSLFLDESLVGLFGENNRLLFFMENDFF